MWFSVCTFLATGGVSELDGFADLSSAAISVAKARNTRMEKHLFTGIIRKPHSKGSLQIVSQQEAAVFFREPSQPLFWPPAGHPNPHARRALLHKAGIPGRPAGPDLWDLVFASGPARPVAGIAGSRGFHRRVVFPPRCSCEARARRTCL